MANKKFDSDAIADMMDEFDYILGDNNVAYTSDVVMALDALKLALEIQTEEN